MGFWTEFAGLLKGKLPGTDVEVYLIEHDVYFDRNGIYGEDREYPDNDRRFIFFSRAVFEVCKAINFKPDIIHAHDFHAAFTMPFLKTHYREDELFKKTAGIFTIHNLAYQGKFAPERAMEFSGFGSENFYIGSWFEHFGMVNAMKSGIMFADKITTVSPTYAKEIRQDYYSEGLQQELNTRSADLIGVLNGADYDVWNPETDSVIYENYSEKTLDLKNKNKCEFYKEAGISCETDKPLIGMVSRMAGQKGFDLVMSVIEPFIASGKIRFAIIGSGEDKYEDYFLHLRHRYPNDTVVEYGYNFKMSHKIFAASDYFLVPSRYEPCGLTQMYAMRYGTIPIVRLTGGLADTVDEYLEADGSGEGFRFWAYDAHEFESCINRALAVYQKQPHWNQIRTNAMNKRFTSEESAKKYLEVYSWGLEKLNY
jgi:starch synthase